MTMLKTDDYAHNNRIERPPLSFRHSGTAWIAFTTEATLPVRDMIYIQHNFIQCNVNMKDNEIMQRNGMHINVMMFVTGKVTQSFFLCAYNKRKYQYLDFPFLQCLLQVFHFSL